METPTKKKIKFFPQTRLGKISLASGLITLILLLISYINSGLIKPMSANLLGFVVFAGIALAIVALICALIAIIKHKDHTIALYLMAAIGIAALAYIITMIIKDATP